MGKKNRRSPKSARRPLSSDDEAPVFSVQQSKTSSSPAECFDPTVGGPVVISLPSGSSGQAHLLKDANPSLIISPDVTPVSLAAPPAKIICPRFQHGIPENFGHHERIRDLIAASRNLGSSIKTGVVACKSEVSPVLLKSGKRVGEARSCPIYVSTPTAVPILASVPVAAPPTQVLDLPTDLDANIVTNKADDPLVAASSISEIAVVDCVGLAGIVAPGVSPVFVPLPTTLVADISDVVAEVAVTKDVVVAPPLACIVGVAEKVFEPTGIVAKGIEPAGVGLVGVGAGAFSSVSSSLPLTLDHILNDFAHLVTQVLDCPAAPVVGIGLVADSVKGCDVAANNAITSDVGASNVAAVHDAALNDISVANKVVSWAELLKKNRLCTKEVVKLWEDNCSSLPSVDLSGTTVEDDDIEKLSLIGTFSSRFPRKDAVRKMVNSWSRKCKFHFHASGWIIFTFENVSDLESVLLGGPYFVFGKPLLLKRMPEFFNFNRDGLSVVNVWIQLPNLPISLWTEDALSKICSFVGKPLYTDLLTATKQRLSFARCLVDIDVANSLPNLIPILLPDGTESQQHVFYEDLPSFCALCKRLGHTVSSCIGKKLVEHQIYMNKNRRKDPSVMSVAAAVAIAVSGSVVSASGQVSDLVDVPFSEAVASGADMDLRATAVVSGASVQPAAVFVPVISGKSATVVSDSSVAGLFNDFADAGPVLQSDLDAMLVSSKPAAAASSVAAGFDHKNAVLALKVPGAAAIVSNTAPKLLAAPAAVFD